MANSKAVLAGVGGPGPGRQGKREVGPNKRQIYAGSVQREGDAFVISVNDRVTRATAVTPALGFSFWLKELLIEC